MNKHVNLTSLVRSILIGGEQAGRVVSGLYGRVAPKSVVRAAECQFLDESFIENQRKSSPDQPGLQNGSFLIRIQLAERHRLMIREGLCRVGPLGP